MNTNNATSKIIFTQLGIIFILQIQNIFPRPDCFAIGKYYINTQPTHLNKKPLLLARLSRFLFCNCKYYLSRSSVYRNVLHHSRVCSDSKNNLTRRLCLEK